MRGEGETATRAEPAGDVDDDRKDVFHGVERRFENQAYEGLTAAEKLPADLEVFRVVSEHFRNDFRMVWEHSSLFILIQGAFLSVFASISEEGQADDVATALAWAGLVLAAVWWWVVLGRMRLVDLWRQAMRRADEQVDQLRIFVTLEKEVARSPLLDSTRVVAWFLPPIFVVGWAALLWLGP